VLRRCENINVCTGYRGQWFNIGFDGGHRDGIRDRVNQVAVRHHDTDCSPPAPVTVCPGAGNACHFFSPHLIIAVYRIKTGTFDYRSEFPDSPLFKNQAGSSKSVAIREIADLWLKLKKPDWANSSYVTTERRARVTLDIIGNGKDIRSIMQKDLLNLRIELLNGSYFTGRKMNIEKKGRTAATVNSSMADLKAIFAFAHGNGYIDANPMTGIKPLKKSNKRPDPITREEYPRLINACATRQTANMWSLAILTGLRHGEICALAWRMWTLKRRS